MAEEKPITKSELVAVLKEADFATKQDVGEIVKQEISALDLVSKSDLREIVREEITEEIARYHDGQVQPDLQMIRKELKQQIEDGFKSVNTQFRFLKDDIEGIKADLANLPTRKQFDRLDKRVTRLEGSVERHHPSN